MSWTSDGIIRTISIALRVLQCVHTIILSLCVCLLLVVVSCSQNVHLLDEHAYLVLILSNMRVSLIRDSHHELLVLVAVRHSL